MVVPVVPFGIIIVVICFPVGVKPEIILGQCPAHESIRRTFGMFKLLLITFLNGL